MFPLIEHFVQYLKNVLFSTEKAQGTENAGPS